MRSVTVAVLLAIAAVLQSGQPVRAQALRVGGTGSAIGLLQHVGAAFTRAARIQISVVPSLGSTGAIHALADNKLDLAVSARAPSAAESALGLAQSLETRTAYVFVTSHSGANGLKASDLPRIFAADKATWADGTPIRIILRPRSEVDLDLLGRLFPGMAAALETARRRDDVPMAATDQDNLLLAERMIGSLTGTTLAQLKTESRNLKIVSLDGVKPTLDTFENGMYPYAKKLYFITRASASDNVRRFVEFTRSPPGIAALREAHVLPGVE